MTKQCAYLMGYTIHQHEIPSFYFSVPPTCVSAWHSWLVADINIEWSAGINGPSNPWAGKQHDQAHCIIVYVRHMWFCLIIIFIASFLVSWEYDIKINLFELLFISLRRYNSVNVGCDANDWSSKWLLLDSINLKEYYKILSFCVLNTLLNLSIKHCRL